MVGKSYNPILRTFSVGPGESIKLIGEPTPGEIAFHDIAILGVGMHDHRYFFSLRRGLSMTFSRDLNGTGVQGLKITRINDELVPPLIYVIFQPQDNNDGDFLYESDLIMDRGKDHEPTVNLGKRPFIACRAETRGDLTIDEMVQWRSDIERLAKAPDTLTGWIEADLEMLVGCRDGFMCRHSTVLTRTALLCHADAGLSLEDLTSRLKCSKCGKREACIMAL